MAYTSKQTAHETQSAEEGAAKQTAPAFTDQRASTGVQLQQQQLMNTTQAKFVTAQRAGVEEEEPLQGKFETAQRAEEEELLQGKFETAQRVEEEELLQGKFETAQRAGVEEEPLQGKVETAQRAEEEELLQGKFETAQLMEEEEPIQGKFETLQRAGAEEKNANHTGMPDNLKSGIENLSGYSMDDVKVHYNSDKPAQLNAHAYAQGTDIHVAPGQEQHLPHEAWHVVQQKQGRVQPTMQMKAGLPVNDDAGLENEADVMGAKALGQVSSLQKKKREPENRDGSIQLRQIEEATSLDALRLVDTGHTFSVIDNNLTKTNATLYSSNSIAEPVEDKAQALSAIASKAGSIAKSVNGVVSKSGGFTRSAENMDKPDVTTVDPFTHGHVQTYGEKYLCLMYQQTHGFDGYVNGIEEGVVKSPGNYGRNFAGAMGQKRNQQAKLDGVEEGDATRYSNIHDPITGDGTLLEDSEKGIEGFDATTKLAGEGARFQWVLNNISTIKNDTRFTIGVHRGKTASITFQNLWCTWKDWFNGQYNISEDQQRETLLEKVKQGRLKTGKVIRIDLV